MPLSATFLAVLLIATNLVTADSTDVQSGRRIGDITPSFVVKDVTGPHKGKPICYVCEFQGAPTILAFFRDSGEPTAELIARLNDLAQRQKALKVVAVLTSGTDQEAWLRLLADDKAITVPMTVFRSGPDDRAMKLYKLNPEAANTVLVSTKRKVSANFVNVTAAGFGQVEEAALKTLARK